MNLSVLPNVLTLFRLFAVGPIVYWLLIGAYDAAAILAVCAGVSDLLDGYLARRYNWVTRFGGVLDPLTDKVFLIGTTGVLAWLNYLPWWLFLLVVARDLVIIGGAFYYHHRVAKISHAEPVTLSKANTFLHILLIVVVMTSLALSDVVQPWVQGLILLVALTTVVSGLQYVTIWSRKAAECRQS